MTEADFFEICEIEGIEIIWSADKFAFYFTMLGEHFIVLPKRKRGLRLLFAMFHELGHYFAHSGDEPETAFLGDPHSRNELEADAVALIALVPYSEIDNAAKELGETRYGDRLWRERKRIAFLYGI